MQEENKPSPLSQNAQHGKRPGTAAGNDNCLANNQNLLNNEKQTPRAKTPPPILFDKKTSETYELGSLLGEGGFARCYQVRQTSNGAKFAAKVIPKVSLRKAKAKQKLLTEIKIHSILKHENIVKFYHAFEDSDNVYLLLEVCDNKSFVELLRRKKRLTEAEFRIFLPQLLSAIEYMHNHSVIHRDLKLGNLFLSSENKIKIGDFGLAALVSEKGERKKTICGTPNYIAPEILFDKANGHSYEVDMWSLGVIMYTVLIGKPPFQTKNINEIYSKIKENKYDFPESISISLDAKSLITSLLNKKPECRPKVAEVLDHQFLKQSVPIPVPKQIKSALTAGNIQRKALTEVTNVQQSTREFAVTRCETRVAALKISDDKVKTPQRPRTALLTAKEKSSQSRKDIVPSYEATGIPAGIQKLRPGMIEAMYKNLCLMCENPKSLKKPVADYSYSPGVFIVKWMDYYNRYGLAYQLTDGSVGVSFIDSSSIILASDGMRFEYLSHKVVDDRKCLFREPCLIDNFPVYLKKKVNLLLKFKEFMSENLDDTLTVTDNTIPKSSGLDFLVKFMRTSHAIVFRLSNRVLQINFTDHTKIILSEEALVVTHIDKHRKISTFSLAQIMENHNYEVISRLKYTKDILEILLSKKPSASLNDAPNSVKPLTEIPDFSPFDGKMKAATINDTNA